MEGVIYPRDRQNHCKIPRLFAQRIGTSVLNLESQYRIRLTRNGRSNHGAIGMHGTFVVREHNETCFSETAPYCTSGRQAANFSYRPG